MPTEHEILDKWNCTLKSHNPKACYAVLMDSLVARAFDGSANKTMSGSFCECVLLTYDSQLLYWPITSLSC